MSDDNPPQGCFGWLADGAGFMVGWACIRGVWFLFRPPLRGGVYGHNVTDTWSPVRDYKDMWIYLGVGASISILILLFGKTDRSRRHANITLRWAVGAAVVFGIRFAVADFYSIEEVGLPGS